MNELEKLIASLPALSERYMEEVTRGAMVTDTIVGTLAILLLLWGVYVLRSKHRAIKLPEGWEAEQVVTNLFAGGAAILFGGLIALINLEDFLKAWLTPIAYAIRRLS